MATTNTYKGILLRGEKKALVKRKKICRKHLVQRFVSGCFVYLGEAINRK